MSILKLLQSSKHLLLIKLIQKMLINQIFLFTLFYKFNNKNKLLVISNINKTESTTIITSIFYKKGSKQIKSKKKSEKPN